jgi:hypothetical protein
MAIDINIATTFLGNTDTPSTYVGQGGKVVSVKVDASGLEFTTVQGGGNIYTENGTLTGNRTVTHNGNTLTFNGTTRVQSPSASSLYTAFAVRNNTDTTDLINVDGTGVVRFYQNLYGFGINYMESIKNPFFLTSGLVIGSGINYNSRGEIGSAYTSHDFTTQNLVTSAGSFLMKISNFTTLHYSMNKDGVENKPTMPTYADNASALVGGLVVGDEYKTATGERRIVV